MITIIIPLHNLGSKGDYCLRQCLDSIINQTYTDFEVLLMENGSIDDTVDIAREYCNKDIRFRLYILDTVGIANARNKGIEYACGEYITFIDGDDYISDDYLESLYNAYTQNDSIELAIAPCYLYYIKSNKKRQLPLDYTHRVLNKSSKIEVFSDGTVWAKLYSAKILNKYNIRFDNELFGVDDTLFISEYRLCINNIAVTDKGSYYYIQGRKGQTSHDKYKMMVDSGIKLNIKLYDLYSKYNNEYKNFIDYELLIFFIGKNFASSALIKMPTKYITNTIAIFQDRIFNIILDSKYCADWQINWFKKFIFFAKKGYGALFLKFMRVYRNLVLSPLGIKYKSKIIK